MDRKPNSSAFLPARAPLNRDSLDRLHEYETIPTAKQLIDRYRAPRTRADLLNINITIMILEYKVQDVYSRNQEHCFLTISCTRLI